MFITTGPSDILNHRRIVVTRATDQAQSFMQKLQEAGASVYALPLIRTEGLDDVVLPHDLADMDWLVLTSANAVMYLEEAFQKNNRSFSELQHVRAVVIGDATAKAALQRGIQVELAPDKQNSNALSALLLSVETAPQGKKVLLPQSDLAKPNIRHALESAGMDVCATTCYRTVKIRPDAQTVEQLAAFIPDAVVFFSPSAVEAYDDLGVSGRLHGLNSGMIYGSIGPVTTAAVRKHGLGPVIEAAQQNEDNLIQSLIAFFHEQSSGPRGERK